MKCFAVVLLLILATFNHASFAQQSIIRGVVSIQNSETFTGKRQYVSNAQVEDVSNKATPTVTSSNGEFKLVYVGISEKKTVSFRIKKQGLDVVDPTKLSAVAGQESVINISMASPDSIDAYRIKLFNIGKTEAERKIEGELQTKNQQLLSLKKDGLKNAAAIKTLQDELDDIHQRINQQAAAIAEKYAGVNLDDASKLFKLAFMHFQKGNPDLALSVLTRMNLSNTVDAILAERSQHPEKEASLSKIAKDAVDALALKAAIHKTDFDADSAAASYELALKIDPFNETYLSALADLLPNLARNHDARINYNKALAIYRRLALTSPELYRPKIALTLSKLGLFAYGWDMDIDADPAFDFAKSTGAFREAIVIYRDLAKKDAGAWLPYLAEALDHLAGRIHFNGERDAGMQEAMPLYQEAISIYKQLANQDALKYQPLAAKILINLTNFYYKKFEFTNGDSTLQEAVKIYQQLAKTPDFPKAADYIDYCKGLLESSIKNRNRFTTEDMLALTAVEHYRQLVNTNSAGYLKELANSLHALAMVLINSDAQLLYKTDNARMDWLEAIAIYRKLSANEPGVYLPYIAENLRDLAACYENGFDSKHQALTYLQLIDTYQQLAKGKPAIYQPLLAETQKKLKALSIDDSFFQNADDSLLQQLTEICRLLAKNDPAFYTPLVTSLQHHLADNYGDHSWFLMMEANFDAAEKIATKGLQLDPSLAFIKANLAHALLFQGKYNDAVKVYTSLKPLKDDSGKSFITICLEDLDALEKKNITNKDVARIRRFLIE